ncbi:hypothetical protein RB600_007088 [Gaeumannomyces tritici]
MTCMCVSPCHGHETSRGDGLSKQLRITINTFARIAPVGNHQPAASVGATACTLQELWVYNEVWGTRLDIQVAPPERGRPLPRSSAADMPQARIEAMLSALEWAFDIFHRHFRQKRCTSARITIATNLEAEGAVEAMRTSAFDTLHRDLAIPIRNLLYYFVDAGAERSRAIVPTHKTFFPAIHNSEDHRDDRLDACTREVGPPLGLPLLFCCPLVSQ